MRSDKPGSVCTFCCKRDLLASGKCTLTPSFGWHYTCGAVQADSGATYSYDAVGNRTDHNALTVAGNRLIKFNGDTITYDDDGNMTSCSAPRFVRQIQERTVRSFGPATLVV